MVELIDDKLRLREGWGRWPIQGPSLDPSLTVEAQEFVNGYSVAGSEDSEHGNIGDMGELATEEWQMVGDESGAGNSAVEGKKEHMYNGQFSGEEWTEVRRKKQSPRNAVCIVSTVLAILRV